MEAKELLPKRLVRYIHETGVRSLDHLAENVEANGPAAVQTLVGHWRAMSTEEKETFVEKVAASVVEVVAASAALPLGLKLSKRAAKAAKKVIRKQTKRIRKAAKGGTKAKAKTKSAKKTA